MNRGSVMAAHRIEQTPPQGVAVQARPLAQSSPVMRSRRRRQNSGHTGQSGQWCRAAEMGRYECCIARPLSVISSTDERTECAVLHTNVYYRPFETRRISLLAPESAIESKPQAVFCALPNTDRLQNALEGRLCWSKPARAEGTYHRACMSAASEPERQRIIATFDEPEDPEIQRLLVSIGRAVTATAALEQALQVYAVAELGAVYPPPDPRFGAESDRLARLSGDRLFGRMKKLGLELPDYLSARIRDAVERRNALIHRSLRDLEFARAAFENRSVDPIVEPINQLATECAALVFELERSAVPKLLAMVGTSPAGAIEMVLAIDPDAVADAGQRKQLRDLQLIAGIDGMADALKLLEDPSSGTG